MAVVGPLALRVDPGCYDLCRTHWSRLSPPRGWELIRLPMDADDPRPAADELLALADAIREVGLGHDEAARPVSEPELGRRKGHLAVVADHLPAAGRLATTKGAT